MSYITTPDLGLELADPSTVQAFETTNVNSNFLLLEAGIVADRVRLSAEEVKSAAFAAGAGRGNLARESALNAAALTAISDGIVGDKVLLTSPGTGISPFWAEMISGTGTGADWVPAETIIADTKANLDAFIAAWIADTDLTFRVGRGVFVTGTATEYHFTSTAGALDVALRCVLQKTGNQTLTTAGTEYAVVWDAEVTDPSGMHDNATNNTRIVLPKVGFWRVHFFLYQNVSTGVAAGALRLNGTTVLQGSRDRRAAAAGIGGLISHTVIVEATAITDYIEVMTSNSAAAATSLVGSTTSDLAARVSVEYWGA